MFYIIIYNIKNGFWVKDYIFVLVVVMNNIKLVFFFGINLCML